MAECSSSSEDLSENVENVNSFIRQHGEEKEEEKEENEGEENVEKKEDVQLNLPEGKSTKSSVKAVLEKLSEFLTENNLEHQIQEERKDISRKIELKNEEISQKRETHRHKLNEVHEAYKREIQRENERHVEDLKVTEKDISNLRNQLEELEQLNIAVSSKIPCSQTNSVSSEREQRRVRELLECPVCLEEMRPPKKIFQCTNGHVICELCKSNPEVRSCPTCRVKFRGHNVVRNIVAEQLARNTFDGSDAEDQINTRSSHTRESNPVEFPGQQQNQDFHLFDLLHQTWRQDEEDQEREEDDDFLAWARIVGTDERSESSGGGNYHRRLADQQQGADSRVEMEVLSNMARDIGGTQRLRETHLTRTYRPNSRYIPHHQWRQRTARAEEDEEAEEDRLRGPRVSRRPENLRLFR